MNRRSVLRGLAALPIATAFSGCRRDGGTDNDGKGSPKDHPEPSKARKLQIILMGPFAVVQLKEQNYRIKAYVPFDDEKRHEFRFPSPLSVEKKHDSYHFTLEAEDIVKSPGQPYVDSGFDGFNVEILEWTPPSNTFVSLDLPAPDLISFLRPAEGVLFESGQYTTLPVNHVLEYTLKEGCSAKLRSEQLDHDATPLSCDDLHQQIIRYGKEFNIPESQYPQHNLMDQTLTRCSDSSTCTFFLGVGLAPPRKANDLGYEQNAMRHGEEFFNEKLLPSLYDSKIPPGKRIVRLKASPCSGSSGMLMSPILVPAVQRLPFPQATYIPAYASTENCTAPAVTATAIKVLGPGPKIQ